MTLTEAKTLLEQKRIPYHTAQYENEAEFWRHCMTFPYTDNAKNCSITALVIPAMNSIKHIELQFNRVRGEYVFEELWFGGYSFEMFDTLEEFLAADILEIIGQIVDGKLTVIECHDLKRKRCLSHGLFDLKDQDAVFGAPGYREAMAKIKAPKTLWQKITGQKLQYHIYDWRTHRQIVK